MQAVKATAHTFRKLWEKCFKRPIPAQLGAVVIASVILSPSAAEARTENPAERSLSERVQEASKFLKSTAEPQDNAAPRPMQWLNWLNAPWNNWNNWPNWANWANWPNW